MLPKETLRTHLTTKDTDMLVYVIYKHYSLVTSNILNLYEKYDSGTQIEQ